MAELYPSFRENKWHPKNLEFGAINVRVVQMKNLPKSNGQEEGVAIPKTKSLGIIH
jgi:hypothetical protein